MYSIFINQKFRTESSRGGEQRAGSRRGAGKQLTGGEEVTGGRQEGVPGSKKCGRQGRASRQGAGRPAGTSSATSPDQAGRRQRSLGRRVKCPPARHRRQGGRAVAASASGSGSYTSRACLIFPRPTPLAHALLRRRIFPRARPRRPPRAPRRHGVNDLRRRALGLRLYP